MNALKTVFALLKDTISDFLEDKAPRLAAAMAYSTIFSLAPLLVIIIAIAGLVLGDEAASGQIAGQISGLVGPEAAQTVQDAVAGARKPSTGIVATIVGIVGLVLGAAGVFGALKDALNTIWEVAPKPNQGILAMVKDRFLSLTMVLGVAFLLLVSLVVSAALAAITGAFNNVLPLPGWAAMVIDNVFSFVVITVLFALIYKILPDVEIQFRDVWIGAAVTALLFTLGKFLIGLYVGQRSFTDTYGAAGSFAILLVWIYYSSFILFLGAEFTQVYAKRFGSRLRPSDNAIPLTEEAKAQQGIVSGERKQETAATGAVAGGAAVPINRLPGSRPVAVGETSVGTVGSIVSTLIFTIGLIVAGKLGLGSRR